MSYTALYRKYRPTNFENVVGQDIIVQILRNSLNNGHVSHAYLFSGPRGTGKTSIAKILAHAVNCENFSNDVCSVCNSCKFLQENDSDIIEIDAASNNGVEEIRTLRDNVKLLPAFCKYKIYIIDEVHMLSTGAFNALLKTLEEPPSHVIFILATTEPNKIPITILSRCQRFDFKKIDFIALENRLKYILEKEDRQLPDNIVSYIASISDGGLRDAINLLDQVLSLSNSNISIDEIDKLSGKISQKTIIRIFESIMNSNYVELLKIIDTLALEGKNFIDVVNNMLTFVRDIEISHVVDNYFDETYNKLLSSFTLDSSKIISVSKILNELSVEMKNSSDQKLIFEVFIIHLIEVINNKDKSIKNYSQSLEVKNDIIDSCIDSEDNYVQKDNNDLNQSESNFNELKKIRINNVLAEANKDILLKINKDYDRINDFISNKKWNTLSALLLEGNVVVASNSYLLFSFNDSSYVSVFDSNYKEIEIFMNELFDHTFKVVAVSFSEWQNIREEFINNKKNNISYVFIDENDVELKVSDNLGELENSALSIFGEDAISVK